MNKSNKVLFTLNKMFHGTFALFWGMLLPGIVVVSFVSDWKGIFFWTVGVILLINLVYRWDRDGCYRKADVLRKSLDKYSIGIFFVCFMSLQILLQIIFGYELAVTPSADRSVIFNQASEIAMTGEWHTGARYNNYFLRYPNNVFLLIVESGYFSVLKSLGITNFLYGNIILNIISVDVAIALCVYLVYKKYGKKPAVLFQLMCLGFVPFYTYIPFVYTDTLTLPVVAGILLCFQLAEEHWEQKKRLGVDLLIIGVLTFVGFELKPTVSFLTIAYAGYLLLIKKKRKVILAIGCIAVSGMMCGTVYTYSLEKMNMVNQVDYDKENFPYTHWIMMGLQGHGNYSLSDRQFTSSFPTKELKQQANLQKIQQRIKDYGVKGLVLHQYVKGISTWHNGKYDMEFHLQRKPLHSSGMQQIFFRDGTYYFLYSGYCSLYHLVLVFMIFVSVWQGYKSKQVDSAVVWKIAVFGLQIFLGLWESKSRYVMHYTPVLLMITVDVFVKNQKSVRAVLSAFTFQCVKRKLYDTAVQGKKAINQSYKHDLDSQRYNRNGFRDEKRLK